MRIVGLISLLLLAPTSIFASVWVPRLDNSFFDELRVTSETKILEVRFSPTTSQAEELNKKTDGDLYWTHKVQAYNSIGGKSSGSCTFGGKDSEGAGDLPMILDCGIRVLRVAEYDLTWGYWFLLKEQRGDWYEVIANPKNGTSKWFKVSKNRETYVQVETIGELLRAGPLELLNRGTRIEIEILEEPKEGARPMARWEIQKPIEEEDGYMKGSTVKGDWIKVDLIKPTCLSKLDPALECGYDPEEKRPLCARGWVRWRSPQGKLLLFPEYLQRAGC